MHSCGPSLAVALQASNLGTNHCVTNMQMTNNWKNVSICHTCNSTVTVPISFSLAESDAVDDAGMVEFVTDHRILGSQQDLKQTSVSIKATGIQDSVLGAMKGADLGF